MTTMPSFTRAPIGPDFTAFDDDGGDSLVDASGNPDYAAIRDSPDFRQVRGRLARFTLPLSAFFFCWYMTYVLLAAYAHDFMSTRVFPHVTLGLLLGLSQFATTVVIMLLYVRFARRNIDPETAALRERAGVN